MTRLLWLCTIACGCAAQPVIIDGKPVPRVSLDYAGQPFVVRLSDGHPDPGSPSGGTRGFGGRISGNVCGIDVVYDVEHRGDVTRLTGFIDNGAFESTFEVRDVDELARVITGNLARGIFGVSVELRVDRLRGAVGLRSFDLRRSGDVYAGSVDYTSGSRAGNRSRATIEVRGAEALWSLPPSAQAAVLPALLSCYGDELEDKLQPKIVVGFGGRQTWESAHVSALYHAGESGANGNTAQAFDARGGFGSNLPSGAQLSAPGTASGGH
jgi:hypothetical protein